MISLQLSFVYCYQTGSRHHRPPIMIDRATSVTYSLSLFPSLCLSPSLLGEIVPGFKRKRGFLATNSRISLLLPECDGGSAQGAFRMRREMSVGSSKFRSSLSGEPSRPSTWSSLGSNTTRTIDRSMRTIREIFSAIKCHRHRIGHRAQHLQSASREFLPALFGFCRLRLPNIISRKNCADGLLRSVCLGIGMDAKRRGHSFSRSLCGVEQLRRNTTVDSAIILAVCSAK
jgi:hypothetical protein